MYDNTIIPSYLGSTVRGSVSGQQAGFGNFLLRVGEVKELVLKDDPRSFTKKVTEYTVEVNEHNDGSAMSSVLYHGCIPSFTFGGQADSFSYTLRPDSGENSSQNFGVGIGSKVLLLCINGLKTNSVIIGGIPSPTTQQGINDGHNLKFEFNGIRFNINNDGECRLTFRGATQHSGELRSDAVASAEGSYIKIDRQGSITVATPSEDQYVKIDHQNRKIEVQAQTAWNTVVRGETNLTADGRVTIHSAGVYVGDATDRWLLADTYRLNESALNTTLAAQASSLSALMATAGSSLTTATPLNAIPVVGGLLAAVPLAAAAAALTAAAPVQAAIATALGNFEAQGPTFLSTKNRND